MEQHIRRFLDQFGPVAGDGGNHRFGGFLAQLLRAFFHAAGNELGGVAFIGRSRRADTDAVFEVVEGHARSFQTHDVIPAKAEIHLEISGWTPACAGVTSVFGDGLKQKTPSGSLIPKPRGPCAPPRHGRADTAWPAEW
jgi:hypothetical protein